MGLVFVYKDEERKVRFEVKSSVGGCGSGMGDEVEISSPKAGVGGGEGLVVVVVGGVVLL